MSEEDLMKMQWMDDGGPAYEDGEAPTTTDRADVPAPNHKLAMID